MKKLFKIHESDIQTMIDNASKTILKEQFGIEEKKSKKIVKLTENDVRNITDRTYQKVMEQHFL